MTALKAKWSEMSRYRRVLLLVMAIEILAFFFATVVMINRPGLEYQDTLLYPGTEGDIQIYQGTVDGETARFAVSPEWEVSYQWGDYTYGPYQITEDPAAVPDGYEGSQGIEIRLGDEVLFRGCYLPNSTLSLIQEDGEPVWDARPKRCRPRGPGARAHPPGKHGALSGGHPAGPVQHHSDLFSLPFLPPEPAGPCAEYRRRGALRLLHRHGANRVGGFGIGVPAVLLHGYDYDTIENAPVPRGGQNEHKKEEKPCRIIFM